MQGNDNPGTFLNFITIALETPVKNQILIYPGTMDILFCKELNFLNPLYH